MKKLRLALTIVLAIGAFVLLMMGATTLLRPVLVNLLEQGGMLDRILFIFALGSLALVIGQGLADVVIALIVDHHIQEE